MNEEFQTDIAKIQAMDAVPRILDIVCTVTGMGFAAVARVTGEHWVALAVRDDIKFGLLPGGELKVETTICDEIRDSGIPVVIDDVAEDQRYCGHPTPKMYGFRSYISVPIMLADGRFFGTLCAIDPQPRKLNTPIIRDMFKLFADLIALQLDSAEKLRTSEASLLDERSTAELREQFIAVLGHDLRNPLSSISAGVNLLLRDGQPEKTREILALMQASVLRMAGLIDNVLDFAHGRLGGGLPLQRDANAPLTPVLEHIVSELQSAHADRTIDAKIDPDENVDCDRSRIGQLLSNLLANALTHGAPDSAVIVRATTVKGTFELSVSNSGKPISEAARAQLFTPFYRFKIRKSLQGLGLGLFIASQIAKAHGGTLDVVSDAEETRFTFRMPLAH